MKNLVNNDFDVPQPSKRKRIEPAAFSDFFFHSQFSTTIINEDGLSEKNKLEQEFFEGIDTLLISLKTRKGDNSAVTKIIKTSIISAGNNIPATKDDLSQQLQQLSKFFNLCWIG